MVARSSRRPRWRLLALAIADPGRAEALGRPDRVRATPIAWILSVAQQPRGIVLRDRGLLELAVCRSSGWRSGSRADPVTPDREADVRATLGVALAMAGRTARRSRTARSAAVASVADPLVAAKILVRRGHVRYFFLATAARGAGRPARRPARASCGRRARLGGAHAQPDGPEPPGPRAGRACGAGRRVKRSGSSCRRVSRRVGRHPAQPRLHRVLPGRPSAGARASTTRRPSVIAALGEDAPVARHGPVRRAVGGGSCRRGGRRWCTAEVDQRIAVPAADARRAAARPGDGGAGGRRARQRRRRAPPARGRCSGASSADWWALRAELAVLLARAPHRRRGRPPAARTAADARAALEAAAAPRRPRWPGCWPGGGRRGRARRRRPSCSPAPPRYRQPSVGLVRATGWHARALERELRGDTRGVLAPAGAGSTRSTQHRARSAARSSARWRPATATSWPRWPCGTPSRAGPATLLEWSERWRATALSQPPVHPPDDDDLAGDLAALRDTRRRLAAARAEGAPTAAQAGRRPRPSRARDPPAYPPPGRAATGDVARFDAERLLASPRRHDVRRARRGRPRSCTRSSPRADGSRTVRGRRRREDAEQVGCASPGSPCGRRRAGGPPTSTTWAVGCRQRCWGTPYGRWATGRSWSLRPAGCTPPPGRSLPALADVPVSVAPSAALWLRARASAPTSTGARVLIAGPGTGVGRRRDRRPGARRHPEAVLLRGRRRHGRAEPGTRWTARPSRTSPRTVSSARTARCSPRSTSTTGR